MNDKNLPPLTYELIEADVGLHGPVAQKLARHIAALASPAAPAAQPSAQGLRWVPVSERLPEWTDDNSVRVLVYTEGYDFGGQQVFDIPAADFHILDDGERGTEETRCASHWMYRDDAVRAALNAGPPAAERLTTCNCRWDGDTQVQQCTLHAAHVDAIHEWAERAKTAEAINTAPPAKAQPVALTEEQRLHLGQAAEMLDDYAEIQDGCGNDCTAKGAEASAYVLRKMLAATSEKADIVTPLLAAAHHAADMLTHCVDKQEQFLAEQPEREAAVVKDSLTADELTDVAREPLSDERQLAEFIAWGNETFNYGFKPETWDAITHEFTDDPTDMAWIAWRGSRGIPARVDSEGAK